MEPAWKTMTPRAKDFATRIEQFSIALNQAIDCRSRGSGLLCRRGGGGLGSLEQPFDRPPDIGPQILSHQQIVGDNSTPWDCRHPIDACNQFIGTPQGGVVFELSARFE
jgi:hypothetical protein